MASEMFIRRSFLARLEAFSPRWFLRISNCAFAIRILCPPKCSSADRFLRGRSFSSDIVRLS
jgi:hypothetical protein